MSKEHLLEQVREFDLFKGFPDAFVETFLSMAIRCSAAPSDVMIEEGQPNSDLLFLLSGEVNATVRGEKVATLSSPGDLMGEMSVLTSNPASASLTAVAQVEYLKINMRQLDQEAAKREFGFRLYHALASLLAGKVVRTNQRARLFEITNRELTATQRQLEEANQQLENKVRERTRQLQASNSELEARNSELVLSHRRMEELFSSKDLTFKRLSDLQSKTLVPLLDSLKACEKHLTSDSRTAVENATLGLEESIRILTPLKGLQASEQSMRSRRVLLVESDRKQQIMTKMALGGFGVKLEIAASEAEIQAHLSSGRSFDLAFISSGLAALIPEVQRRLPHCQIVFMASSNVPAELPNLRESARLISNIVSRHPEDRTFTVKNVATTAGKLVSGDMFGLEKYMLWGLEVPSLTVSRSDERPQLIDQMKDHFTNLGVRSTISDRAGAVAEELLMNAIFDAPVGSDGEPLHNQKSRTELVELAPEHQSEFRFACDGMLAAISVKDPFGGFTMKTLLDYLESNYAGSADPQEPSKGGAGRGLHQIIENSDLVIFNVHKKVRTEVIALFHLDPKMVLPEAKPSFHFFLK